MLKCSHDIQHAFNAVGAGLKNILNTVHVFVSANLLEITYCMVSLTRKEIVGF